jgi:hypothetical protein
MNKKVKRDLSNYGSSYVHGVELDELILIESEVFFETRDVRIFWFMLEKLAGM